MTSTNGQDRARGTTEAHEREAGSTEGSNLRLAGKRAAVVTFSPYPADPRPRREAEALLREGMKIEVICLRQGRQEAKREVFGGVDIYRVPMKRRRGGKLSYVLQYVSFISIAFLLLAARALRRRYHLVHVHNMPDVLVFSALVPKLLGARVILDQHDPMPELMMTIFGLAEGSRVVGMLRVLEKWSMALADVVLTVNLACRTIFAARSCRAEKIKVVMNSPDESIFPFRAVAMGSEEMRRGEGRYVVMYHGSLVERHGLDLAVSAVAALRRSIPGIQLRVYGQQTPFLQKVLEDVAQRGLETTVVHLGEKRLEEIREAIDGCDLGIIPNRRSIFTEINTPTRIFEYLARGRAVVAPRARGIQDYFSEDALLFFELGDAEDLARSIEYAYRHPAEVEAIVKRGQAIYLIQRWNQQRANLVNWVAELLGLPAGPAGAPSLRQESVRAVENSGV